MVYLKKNKDKRYNVIATTSLVFKTTFLFISLKMVHINHREIKVKTSNIK